MKTAIDGIEYAMAAGDWLLFSRSPGQEHFRLCKTIPEGHVEQWWRSQLGFGIGWDRFGYAVTVKQRNHPKNRLVSIGNGLVAVYGTPPTGPEPTARVPEPSFRHLSELQPLTVIPEPGSLEARVAALEARVK